MPVRSNLHFAAGIAAVREGLSDGLVDAAKKEVEHTETALDNDVDATGRPLAPLAESTIRQKGHSSILFESGDLQNSFWFQKTGPLSVAMGNSDPKSALHVYGTERMPARDFISPMKSHLQQEVLWGSIAMEIRRSILALRFRSIVR